MQPNCATASCHSPAAAIAGLDFSDPDSGYASLTGLHVFVPDQSGDGGSGCGTANGVAVCERTFRPLIVPYDPNESRLVNMLRARNAPRMPPDRPLAEDDIRLIERWILNGARKDEGPTVDAGDAGKDSAPGTTDGGAQDGGDGAAVDGSADSTSDGRADAGGG
jgi:hypothetical protein